MNKYDLLIQRLVLNSILQQVDFSRTFDSFQVAEWMGRREAWSAEKSSDSRTKSTQWEFRRRNVDENLESNALHIPTEKSPAMKLK